MAQITMTQPVRIETPTNKRLGNYKKIRKIKNRSQAIDDAINKAEKYEQVIKNINEYPNDTTIKNS